MSLPLSRSGRREESGAEFLLITKDGRSRLPLKIDRKGDLNQTSKQGKLHIPPTLQTDRSSLPFRSRTYLLTSNIGQLAIIIIYTCHFFVSLNVDEDGIVFNALDSFQQGRLGLTLQTGCAISQKKWETGPLE